MGQFKITKPVRLIELFGGIGAQSSALKRLGIPFELWRLSEWDVNAAKSYKAIHFPDDNTDYSADKSKDDIIKALIKLGISTDGKSPMSAEKIAKKSEAWLRETYNIFRATRNIGSITNRSGEDLGINNTDEYTTIVTYSFPCFVEGTLVMTENGYKEIQDIVVGEKVLTHTNKWQEVKNTFINEADFLVSINCMPSEKIHCTPNHPFYVRRMERVHNSKTGCSERKFYEPEWINAKDLTKEYYVGTAINQIEEVPKWDGIDIKDRGGRIKHVNELQSKLGLEDFWYIIGRYIGDGWIANQGGIFICGNDEEIGQIISVLDRLNLHYGITDCRTVKRIRISFQEIGVYCEQFGRGAANKHLTSDILNLPINLLKSFLNGYMDADGTYTQNKFKATSVSRRLIYEIAQCVHKAYHRPTAIYYTQRPKTTVIEGRTVNQKDTYSLTFTLDKRLQDHAFYEDGYIWSPIKIVENEEYNGLVYNLEIEEDNSYQIQNVIVHNCQDLSLAGRQAGMSKGSQTRSGLLWEVERLLKECKEMNCLPEVLLMENVPQVHNKKNLNDWNMWLASLEEMGYKNFYKDLNAKNFGVAQNRNRTFMISLLEGEYIFPEEIELKKKLKDYLEDKVDEKYYMNNEKAYSLIVDLINRGVLPQRERERVTAYLNYKRVDKTNVDIAKTIMARDYKGFNTGFDTMNGVIESE